MDGEIFIEKGEFLPGYVVYEVVCSHRGMTAVRRMIDRDWGRGWNGSELAERPAKGVFDPYMLKAYEQRWMFWGRKHVILDGGGRLVGVFDLSFTTGMYQQELFTLPDTRIYRAFLDKYGSDDMSGNEFDESRVREYLQSPDWRVRREAVIRLSKKKNGGFSDHDDGLRQAMADPSPEVRLAAVYSFVGGWTYMSGGIRVYMNPALDDGMLDDANDVVRCAAACKCVPTTDAARRILARGASRMARYFEGRDDLPADVLVVMAEHCKDPGRRASLLVKAMEMEG